MAIKIRESKLSNKEDAKELNRTLKQSVHKDTFDIDTKVLENMDDATGTDLLQIIEIRRLLLLLLNNGKGQ